MTRKRKTPDRSMNLGEFARHLHKKFGLPRRFADEILKEVFDTITRQLNQGRRVKLRGFGTFEMRKSWGKLRPKFNPSTTFNDQLKKRSR